MGLWVGKPRLKNGERLEWKKNANRQQGPIRAVGGRLYLTNERLIFSPNRVDRITRGESWQTSLTEITEIGLESTGLRKRLSVAAGENTDLFVVNSPGECVNRIRNALEST